jgi:hypothetical protein
LNRCLQPSIDIGDGLRHALADGVDRDGFVIYDLEDHTVTLTMKAAVFFERLA